MGGKAINSTVIAVRLGLTEAEEWKKAAAESRMSVSDWVKTQVWMQRKLAQPSQTAQPRRSASPPVAT